MIGTVTYHSRIPQSYLNPYTFTFDTFDDQVTADFRTAVILTITNPGTGSGRVDYGINGRPWQPAPLTAGQVFDVSVPDGGYVYLRYLAGYEDPGSVFNGFSGDGGPSGSLWFVSSINGGENVNATFELSKFTVKVFDGVGENSIKLEYGATSVSCSDTCTYNIPQ
ncbi:MAG: hypothetical protein ACYTBZ_31595, partial [Planctomycetota bacterium]